MWLNSSRVEIG